MSVYVIADLHLSVNNPGKSMEIFGNRWIGYQTKIEKNWRRIISERDTVVIPGDISWGLTLEDAADDIAFVDSLPGKKVLMKGNHDFWWSTASKMEKYFSDHGFNTLSILNNNAIDVGEYIITGSRGWFTDPSSQTKNVNADFDKINNRENIRLKISLEKADELRHSLPEKKEILAFFHFPPLWNGFVNEGTLGLLEQYGVRRAYFGHIHGQYSCPGRFKYKNIDLRLISADYLDFYPFLI